MSTCKECQKKIAAVFDNEGTEADMELITVHLKECPECRAFRLDMENLRQKFISLNIPESLGEVKKELMQIVQADSQRSENSRGKNKIKSQVLSLNNHRLTWITGLAASFLIIISLLTFYIQTKKITDLENQLEVSRQELMIVQQDLAVAKAEKRREEDLKREQNAISALYFRMQELEDRFEKYSSPTRTFRQAEGYWPTETYGDTQ